MFKATRLEGLTTNEAQKLLQQYGPNAMSKPKKSNILLSLLGTLKEPMFLLLIFAATIYFFLGEPRDGAIMLIFVFGIVSIEAIQEWKTDKTLKALKQLSSPHSTVTRDGVQKTILSCDLVPGDLLHLYEGVKIAADGYVIESKGLCVDESTLTGEAQGKWKEVTNPDKQRETSEFFHPDYCYAGTLVIQGGGLLQVAQTGINTEFGKIGEQVLKAPKDRSPLQEQTSRLVKFSTILAIILLILVAIFTFFNIADHDLKARIIESILAGITLAMAMIPEEFPVILTIFLSMGAWRLAKNKHSLIRKLPAVETLGEVTVLCVDKTGTLTENQMLVQKTWQIHQDGENLMQIMNLSCEHPAFDPLDKAMLRYTGDLKDNNELSLVKTYAFSSQKKMAGNLYLNHSHHLLAVKGSYEAILPLCQLTEQEITIITTKADEFANLGLRVLALGMQNNLESTPETLDTAPLIFVGLVGLIDPPRASIKSDMLRCKRAGVRVIMITGDNGVTAHAIAHQIGLDHQGEIVTGHDLDTLNDDELKRKLKTSAIIARVIPEHKMRIVKALKECGEVVAMTGDGVNDAPALKYADIGIAMGLRGSEVAKEAADLILLDDNFSTIVDTIADGRRIYDNIRKAIGYVFAIHIPIALISLCGPLLGISPNALFLLPLHVVLLEMVIDPTCSIVLERQPAESDIMNRPPRKHNEPLWSFKKFGRSFFQGLAIFLASFGIYYYTLHQTGNAELARTMGLALLFLGNLLLVQVIGSNIESAFSSVKRLKNDRVLCFVNLGIISALLLCIYSPINHYLKLQALSLLQWIIIIFLAIISTFWIEIVKFIDRKKLPKI